MKAKGTNISYDLKTGITDVTEQEFDFPDVQPVEPVGVNLDEVREMLEWFKKKVKPTLK